MGITERYEAIFSGKFGCLTYVAGCVVVSEPCLLFHCRDVSLPRTQFICFPLLTPVVSGKPNLFLGIRTLPLCTSEYFIFSATNLYLKNFQIHILLNVNDN